MEKDTVGTAVKPCILGTRCQVIREYNGGDLLVRLLQSRGIYKRGDRFRLDAKDFIAETNVHNLPLTSILASLTGSVEELMRRLREDTTLPENYKVMEVWLVQALGGLSMARDHANLCAVTNSRVESSMKTKNGTGNVNPSKAAAYSKQADSYGRNRFKAIDQKAAVTAAKAQKQAANKRTLAGGGSDNGG